MDIIEKLQRRAIRSRDIGADDAHKLFEEGATRPFQVMAAAAEIRRHFKGDDVSL
ncbi:MAG: hypothetical protein NTZ57_02270 [Deltaproteobacteria bacterium]|nr:hypothetical protein [Deltaproteobacteria bacterium]